MTDSPTLKAVVSTLLMLAVIFSISAMGNTIGKQSPQTSAPSAVSSPSQADAPTHGAPHNLTDASQEQASMRTRNQH